VRQLSPRPLPSESRGGKRTVRSVHSFSSNSFINCSFKCRRAAFFIARRSAAIASFSACRSRRVRGSADCATCLIFGRRAPTFRSFGLAYGSMKNFTVACSPQKESESRLTEELVKTARPRRLIYRRAIPLLRCRQTRQFRIRYQTAQMPCCVSAAV
jgi:hypothetical protein